MKPYRNKPNKFIIKTLQSFTIKTFINKIVWFKLGHTVIVSYLCFNNHPTQAVEKIPWARRENNVDTTPPLTIFRVLKSKSGAGCNNLMHLASDYK